ncbi:MAG TPA: elongation factor 1-beta [Methanolinea sp.]|jgi:elongation factor 1-beta|nr:elongation factor 1-beta [Methanolinea sp.]MDH7509755.1 elongation factor 1-beta [Methanolinea sp.]MDI6899286.1 elongation factor 1-beta [Methanolinea sp.]HOS81274.1 elongation factor 1-beta [Methanolinea sp.]HPC54547.1 elongation factor 1-beta [Methanolinea sp.]
MGTVAVILKVMPESPDVDLVKLKDRIKNEVPAVRDIREEPIGFGLKALIVAALVNDAAGESDAVEAAIQKIPGVERAEITEVTLT